MRERAARLERITSESKVTVSLDLDGAGRSTISTGVGFYDHMLIALAKHALFDLEVASVGDMHIDGHHVVEDTAIVLGQARPPGAGGQAGHPAFRRRSGAARRGVGPGRRRRLRPPVLRPHRGAGRSGVRPHRRRDGDSVPYAGSLTRHVFETLAFHAYLCVHVTVLAGRDPHHIVEAQFKALARALRDAIALDPRVEGVPSTKGAL